jgi:sucrose phosphorylase
VLNHCQLITYPDSLGGNLATLQDLLQTGFKEALGGVHILPFFPSSGDRGFAPLTYREVDPAFGSWDDVRKIADSHELVVDFMFNHISRQSSYFQDYLENHQSSSYAGMFIPYSRFWPGGMPSKQELAQIYTRKPRPPYLEVEFADGQQEKVWCTFDHEQIDLDFHSPVTQRFIRESLEWLALRGARVIRLDAFAYATKRPGSSCFFLEPDVWEMLAMAQEVVSPFGTVLLPEVHEHHTLQLKLAEHGYWVYDFALPMLVLQALYEGHGANLKAWLRKCPRKQVTTLDTHDGIGVVDVVDLMSREEIERTKETLFRQGASVKAIYNTAAYGNLDVYQLNCTYYSALGEDDQAYLLARAIQFFAPGVPQVYYVGALAGSNDNELAERTRLGRDINRHSYTPQEIDQELEREVVQRLLEMMRFRNAHPAFGGELTIREEKDHRLSLRWELSRDWAELSADLKSREFEIRHS